jgi:acetyltransferase-like isoleucine patch superfamily enzyme
MMIYAKLSPVGYARHIGVNIKGRVFIYGSSFGMFGTEPYLITLGDNVHITPDATFLTHDGGILIARKDIPDLDVTKPIVVGDNTFVGTMALIMPGVSIGNNCIIGARAVVTKDVADNSVVAGHPARRIKSTQEYLEQAAASSLHIGHLYGSAKVKAYKRIFGISK